jgi:hypothetical protein
MAAGSAGHSLRSRFDFSWAARPCDSLYLRTVLDCVHSPARKPGLRETPRGRRESFGRHRSAQSTGGQGGSPRCHFSQAPSRSIWTECCYCKFSLNNLRRAEHLSPCYAATAHRRKTRRAGIHPFDKLLDNCGAPWPSQQILRQRVWKQTGDSLLWSSAAQLRRQLIRRARTGWADQDPEKPSTASACSSNSTLCSIPARGPPSTIKRLRPLQLTTAPSLSLVCVAPCWAFWLHSPVILTLLLHFFLNTFFSLTGSIIGKFDIAARSISVFIPACLDLVVRLSLSYRHRQSRHSLREIQKQQSTHRSLIPLSDRAFHIHPAFPRTWPTYFPPTYSFQISLGRSHCRES